MIDAGESVVWWERQLERFDRHATDSDEDHRRRRKLTEDLEKATSDLGYATRRRYGADEAAP